MESPTKFGPKEATREQRLALTQRVAALNATQDRQLSAFAEQLSQRYVEGELSLAEVNAQLDAHYKAQPMPAAREADGRAVIAPRPAVPAGKSRSISH